jgi:hypothetical protein
VLADAVDIRRWLRDDRRTPYPERLARDRAIGRELSAQDDVERVRVWWRRVGADAAQAPSLGARVAAARRLGSAALVVLGFLLGSGIAAVAFASDGRSPVNLFTLLGVLVGLPLVLLLFTLLLMPGRLPGLGAIQGVAAGMNLGRWVGSGLDRLLGAELFAPQILHSGSGSAFSRWQLVVFSQWLALGFFGGALTVALLRVTFTDLAFGWGTTLRMDPALVHAWTTALSAPWAAFVPAAVPDAGLVEVSRIYRLEQTGMAPERVQQLGAWWPFVLMTIVVYGALPRLVLMLVGAWRLRDATRRLLRDDPEVTALLDRLNAPLVRLEGQAAEEPRAADGEELAGLREPVSAHDVILMIWNRAVTAEQARAWLAAHLGVAAAAVLDLGILQSAAEQRALLEAARQRLESVRRVILVTKGWEPPLLEFIDFIALVREAFGADCSISVVPLAVSGVDVHPPERDVWARALAKVRDPRLYVQEAGG